MIGSDFILVEYVFSIANLHSDGEILELAQSGLMKNVSNTTRIVVNHMMATVWEYKSNWWKEENNERLSRLPISLTRINFEAS